jgi:hypothetical protein
MVSRSRRSEEKVPIGMRDQGNTTTRADADAPRRSRQSSKVDLEAAAGKATARGRDVGATPQSIVASREQVGGLCTDSKKGRRATVAVLASVVNHRILLLPALPFVLFTFFALSATPAAAAPVWNVTSEALPTAFQSTDTTNKVQRVMLDATGGTFTLSFGGDTTRPIKAPEGLGIESDLDGLGSIAGVGASVIVAESPTPHGPEENETLVSFGGSLLGKEVPLITADGSSLTGARPAVSIVPSTNDAYQIDVANLGTSESSGPVTVVDHLPAGITISRAPQGGTSGSEPSYWNCGGVTANQSVVTCTLSGSVFPATTAYNIETPQGHQAAVQPLVIPVQVASGTAEMATNTVTVSGGGATSPATDSEVNPVGLGPDLGFGTASLNFHVLGEDGASFSQAGGHPYAITTSFAFNQELSRSAPTAQEARDEGSGADYENVPASDEPRTIVAELPLGLVGDPLAAPRCPADLFAGGGDNVSNCPADTRVGVAFAHRPPEVGPYQLFNLVPDVGHAAEFGITVQSFPIVFYGDVVRSARGYALRVTARLPQARLAAVSLTFFGDPAAAFATGGKESAFLTNPVDCNADEADRTLGLHVDTWTAPGIGDPFEGDFTDPAWVPAGATLPPVEGCEALKFDPSLSLAPDPTSEGGTSQADEPSGYSATLEVPQTESYSELATPELKTATVTLPAGVSISPAAANGLQACSDAQIALGSNEPGSCPLASQIGSAKVTTPLLESPLEGQVFVGEPECGTGGICTAADASEGHIFRLFLQVHSRALGVTIKLPGTVKANPATGQLIAQFAENPQLPFNDLELHFNDGPRAPLVNPQTCGTFTTASDLEPWSAPQTPTAVSESSFAITGCGASLPFAPSFAAGTAVSAASAYSPFSVTFSRGDGEQDLGAIDVSTPPGLLGKIAGVPRCGEAEANAGTCSSASQIGTTTVSAGSGTDPYTITGGRVYLTGAYDGRPFGLSVVVPAVAGPFNLGNVVVRAAIAVNPATAALTIASNPLPQIVDGVPIRLRSVIVEVNRPAFMLNATSCSEQAISATIAGEHPIGSGEAPKTSTVSSAYAPSGCADLPFKPTLIASAGGKGSKAGGSALDVKLESTGLGQSNIAKLDLQIPKALSTRDSTLNKACTEAVFDADPAGCPEGSIIGNATVHTPLLDDPLVGPVYLVSHGGAAFPDVELVLQGEGVVLVLDGKTDIKKGITYSNFESTPDAPFTTFETELPTGPHSIFTANVPAKAKYSLCGTRLTMPTRLVGQNGAVIEQTTNVAVTGCKVAKSPTRAQKLERILKLCKKEKKREKASCEKQARERYRQTRQEKPSNKKRSR